MFEGLSKRLGDVFDKLRGRGALTEADVDATIKRAMEINDQPVVVDFVVSSDAMVWPMVPVGVTNDEIQYAKHVAPRFDRED